MKIQILIKLTYLLLSLGLYTNPLLSQNNPDKIIAEETVLKNKQSELQNLSLSSNLVKPFHNEKAAAILVYLSELHLRDSGRCLSGQAVGANANPVNEASNFQNLVVKLGTQTGHRPAVLEYGVTKLNGSQMTPADRQTRLTEIKTRVAEGYLIYLGIRPSNPTGVPNNAPNTTPDFYINDASTITEPGGIHYQAYRNSLEYIATFIDDLQEANISVLLEVFNEFNGGWNWFGNQTPEEFKELYRYTHDYFNKERRFTNLVYVLEYSANTTNKENIPAAQYYPGDDYVDLVGFDFYNDDPKDEYVGVYNQLLAFEKPIAMTEFGPNNRKFVVDNPGEPLAFRWDNMIQLNFTKTYYPKVCFFIRWQADWATVNQNNAKSFMEDPFWLHLDGYKQDAVSVDEFSTNKLNSLQLYPNPVKELLYIELDEKEDHYITIDILSADGRMVYKETVNQAIGIHQINVSDLPRGLYIITAENKQGKFLVH